MLAERIKEDLKTAMKSGNAERAGVLRLLISEIYNKEKEKFGGAGGVLDDADAAAVLRKESKKRKEAVELFRKGKREDLAKKDEAEIKIIAEYLPKELSREEIRSAVEKLAAQGHKDFNSLMREAMKEFKGRASGSVVGEIVKEILS